MYIEATHLPGVYRYFEAHHLYYRWKLIGLLLQVTYSDLEIIQDRQDSVEGHTMAMLHQWLTSGRATKQALVEAVQEVK